MRAALATLVAAAVLAATLIGTASSAGPDPDVAARSRALTEAPPSSFADPGPPLTREQARAASAELWAALPLPAGGNLAGVRLDEADGLTAADLRLAGQYNAACQWARAARDGREAENARAVLGDVPRWPAFRAQPLGDLLAGAVAELRAGGGTTASEWLRDCDAIHEREVAYARARGAVPSS